MLSGVPGSRLLAAHLHLLAVPEPVRGHRAGYRCRPTARPDRRTTGTAKEYESAPKRPTRTSHCVTAQSTPSRPRRGSDIGIVAAGPSTDWDTCDVARGFADGAQLQLDEAVRFDIVQLYVDDLPVDQARRRLDRHRRHGRRRDRRVEREGDVDLIEREDADAQDARADCAVVDADPPPNRDLGFERAVVTGRRVREEPAAALFGAFVTHSSTEASASGMKPAPCTATFCSSRSAVDGSTETCGICGVEVGSKPSPVATI